MVHDDYQWLANERAPDVRAWLDGQNRATRSC
jgi:hypothetical protein